MRLLFRYWSNSNIWFKHETKYCVLRFINLSLLFGIKKNCHSSGVTGNFQGITFVIYIQNAIQNSSSGLTSCIGEIVGDYQNIFWCNRSFTDHIYCIHEIVEWKVRVQWESTWAIYRWHFCSVFMMKILVFIVVFFFNTWIREEWNNFKCSNVICWTKEG